MGYPELDRDEPIILESRNVKFKSISFDAILTNKRIHLTDSKKNVIPSQDISLSIIRNVENGENAIRDHFLILSLVTDAGEKHQVVLTFARQAGVERKRECNEWAKKLKSLIPPSVPIITPSYVSEIDKESLTKREVPTPAQGTATSTGPAKKKIEITRPRGTVIEKIPMTPQSEEPSGPPSGSFCTCCGNRVPLKSTFCNNCGTPITQPSELSPGPKPPVPEVKVSVPPRQPLPVGMRERKKVQPPTPQPVVTKVQETVLTPAPQPVVTKVQETVLPPAPQPVVAKVQETLQPSALQPVVVKKQVTLQSPADSQGAYQGSLIGQSIHSSELPVKDSEPHVWQDPALVQPYPSSSQGEPPSTDFKVISSPQVVWPVFSRAEFPAGPAKEVVPATPPSPSPPPAPEGKKPNYLAIGVLIMAILPILAGIVIVANIMSAPPAGPANTTPIIPVPTTLQPQLPQTTITPVVTFTLAPGLTQVVIPPTGVWVRVSYPGTYIGLIGTTSNQTEVTDKGDHLYQIPATERTVAAALQKTDSSGDQIILEVYKNGVMLKRESSISPKGIVEIQLDLKTL